MLSRFEEVIDMDLSDEGCFTKLVAILQEREADDIYDELLEMEKHVWCIFKLAYGVGSGGFQSYFNETDGSYVDDTIDVLSTIGLDIAANIVKRAAKVYTGQLDEVDKSDLFLDLSEEFLELEPWYEIACQWCIEEIEQGLSNSKGWMGAFIF